MNCNRTSNFRSNSNALNGQLRNNPQNVGGFLGTVQQSGTCCVGSSGGKGNALDPCLQSMRYVLAAIDDIVRSMPSGFSVDVEITMTDGTTHTVTFNNSNCAVRIAGNTLTADDLVISICAIAKLRVLTGGLVGSTFETQLLSALSCLASRCCPEVSCGDACLQDIQNYLYCHQSSIAAVSFEGGLEIIQNILAPIGINYTNVVDSASLNTTSTSALSSVALNTDSTSVTSAVTPANTTVVNSVTGDSATVVTDITSTSVDASAPITSTPTEVVTGVSTTSVAGLAQNLSTTTTSVVREISTDTTTVLTGLGTPSSLSGVISGLTDISSLSPASILIPYFTSGDAGPLIVTIDGQDYPVTAGGDPVVYGGTLTAFVFPSDSNFLGGVTGTPALSTVSQPGTPTTASVISTIEPDPTSVVSAVLADTVSGQFVNNVSTGTVGSVTNPTTVSALSGIEFSTESIETLDTVGSIPASSLFSTDTTDVLDSATLSTTATGVLASASLSTSSQNVVGSISTTLVDIAVPVIEDIDGSVSAVGCGIMAVNNDDGDVSVYSVCDINAIETD